MDAVQVRRRAFWECAGACSIEDDIGLQAAIPLTDAIFTSPAIAGGRIYVLDGAGVLFCVDAKTRDIVWQFRSPGGARNCNNYSSPAVVEGFVHFGTMAGQYFVLDARDGRVVRQIECGEPVFSCPVVGPGGVYFATLGSRVFALSPAGPGPMDVGLRTRGVEVPGRSLEWPGLAGLQEERVTWREQFLCSREMAVHGKTLVVPAGGSIVWLADRGDQAQMLGGFAPNESPSTLGLSLDAQGTVYRQWFRRDNGGRVEVLRIVDDKVEAGFVAGTETDYQSDPSMSFSSVSIRGDAVYRCRPEAGVGLCRHEGGQTVPLGDYPSIAPPILAGDRVLVAGLDGRLAIVPLEAGRIALRLRDSLRTADHGASCGSERPGRVWRRGRLLVHSGAGWCVRHFPPSNSI